jgi:hypothetical protein
MLIGEQVINNKKAYSTRDRKFYPGVDRMDLTERWKKITTFYDQERWED